MQVSMNVERPLELSLAEVVRAVAAHAPVQSAELVGLAPSIALEGFPEEVALVGFDPARPGAREGTRLLHGSDKAQDQAPWQRGRSG